MCSSWCGWKIGWRQNHRSEWLQMDFSAEILLGREQCSSENDYNRSQIWIWVSGQFFTSGYNTTNRSML